MHQCEKEWRPARPLHVLIPSNPHWLTGRGECADRSAAGRPAAAAGSPARKTGAGCNIKTRNTGMLDSVPSSAARPQRNSHISGGVTGRKMLHTWQEAIHS